MMAGKARTFLNFFSVALLAGGVLSVATVASSWAQRNIRKSTSPDFIPFLPGGFDSFGSVSDGKQPIPHYTLRFRDRPGGRVIYSLTTNDRGFFRAKGLDKFATLPVDGFALQSRQFSTGGGTFYVFAPLDQQTVELRDTHGHLLPGIKLVQHDARSTNPVGVIETDAQGKACLVNTNALSRYTFHSFKSAYGVYQMTPEIRGKDVLYHLRAEKNGSVVGSFHWQSGAPLRGFYAYAVPTDTPFLPWNSRHMAVTGPEGRFRLEGLLPGRYNIGVESPHRPRNPASPIRELIHVQSDATTQLPKLTVPDSWSTL